MTNQPWTGRRSFEVCLEHVYQTGVEVRNKHGLPRTWMNVISHIVRHFPYKVVLLTDAPAASSRPV
jgi:hypothetical protein